MSGHVVLLLVLPLLGAFALPPLQRSVPGVVPAVGPVLLAVQLILALGLWPATASPLVVQFGGFAPPLGIVFYVDHLALGAVIALSASALLLWPRLRGGGLREAGLTLLLVTGGTGLALSGDLFNAYVFYEVVAVASYGLAASERSGAGFAAALRYLVLGAVGSALALVGIALIYRSCGTLNLAQLAALAPARLHGPTGLMAFALLVLGFGVKAELFPVNTWVPEVYATAPVRVSGLLAGIVSKLALLLLLRVLWLLFAGTGAFHLLLLLGLLTLAGGELAAFRARRPRRILAFSSIGQLGLVAVAWSLGSSAGIVAGIALALHHLLVKPALFLYTEQAPEMEGGGAHHPLYAGLFALFALSLIGVPPLPGFWAKLLLLRAAFAGADPWHLFAAAVVLLATVVEAAYLLRLVARLYRPAAVARWLDAEQRLRIGVFAALLAVGVVVPGSVGLLLQRVGGRIVDTGAYIHQVLPGGAAHAVRVGRMP